MIDDKVRLLESKINTSLASQRGDTAKALKTGFDKASKAALNMYMHTLAFETPKRGVTLVMLHPGIVGTNEMLARFPGALETEDSVRQMLAVIDGLTPADNGRFIDYRGETMPW